MSQHTDQQTKLNTDAPEDEKDPCEPVIAHRRSCQPEGTGLSHYILVEDKAQCT